MSKIVAIIQSNYIPWKGYFDFINSVDEFILFDNVQYTRRDWRNRNLIKTPNGTKWLTIPVMTKGKYLQRINETRISNSTWNKIHWKTIVQNYSRAPYFQKYSQYFENLYFDEISEFLSLVNYRFLKGICDLLDIRTEITWSTNYSVAPGLSKSGRLIALCEQAGATTYISGPAAKNYIEENLFRDKGIDLCYMDYSDYLEYPQLFPPFKHGVSIIDLIFNVGPDATVYMKSSR